VSDSELHVEKLHRYSGSVMLQLHVIIQ